jgi:hypothetical protein
LGKTENELEKQLISTFEREMYSELNKLKEEENEAVPGELSLNIKFNDIFEFVDTGCCHFLTNVSLMASTFLQLFNKHVRFIYILNLFFNKIDVPFTLPSRLEGTFKNYVPFTLPSRLRGT